MMTAPRRSFGALAQRPAAASQPAIVEDTRRLDWDTLDPLPHLVEALIPRASVAVLDRRSPFRLCCRPSVRLEPDVQRNGLPKLDALASAPMMEEPPSASLDGWPVIPRIALHRPFVVTLRDGSAGFTLAPR